MIAAGTAVVVVVASLLAFAAVNTMRVRQTAPGSGRQASPSASSPSPTSTVTCDQLEHTLVHYHAALQILNRGAPVAIPTSVGRTATCFYWLHMHDGEPGIIHIEAPGDRTFTLGDFFYVWDAWSTSGGGPAEVLDSTHVASYLLTSDQKVAAYVDPGDGSGAQPFTGDPRTIVLRNREVITVEITPPTVSAPVFSFPPGF